MSVWAWRGTRSTAQLRMMWCKVLDVSSQNNLFWYKLPQDQLRLEAAIGSRMFEVRILQLNNLWYLKQTHWGCFRLSTKWTRYRSRCCSLPRRSARSFRTKPRLLMATGYSKSPGFCFATRVNLFHLFLSVSVCSCLVFLLQLEARRSLRSQLLSYWCW